MDFVTLVVAAALVAGQGGDAVESTNANHPRVALETTKGRIVLELDAEKAPKTVENFLGYVRSGHYDGTIFHRVIRAFMIQGGGFDAKMNQKPTGTKLENEADNGLKNVRGSIAMARTGDPHSATAQFFINTVDNAPLDFRSKSVQGWGYAVFGKVVEGMEVVDEIEKVRTGSKGPFRDVPVETITIERATVLE